jgi:hypothetical protein
VLLQYLRGSFSDVEVSSPQLTVNGVPARVEMTGTGVAPDMSKPVPSLTGSIGLTPKTVASIANVPGASAPPTFGSGGMTFTGTQSVDGAPVPFEVTMTPSLANGTLTLTPTKATVTKAPAGLDPTVVTGPLMALKPSACVASYLPGGATPTGTKVTTKALELGFSAKNVKLSSTLLASRGSC